MDPCGTCYVLTNLHIFVIIMLLKRPVDILSSLLQDLLDKIPIVFGSLNMSICNELKRLILVNIVFKSISHTLQKTNVECQYFLLPYLTYFKFFIGKTCTRSKQNRFNMCTYFCSAIQLYPSSVVPTLQIYQCLQIIILFGIISFAYCILLNSVKSHTSLFTFFPTYSFYCFGLIISVTSDISSSNKYRHYYSYTLVFYNKCLLNVLYKCLKTVISTVK